MLPYYHMGSDEKAHEAITKGELPYVDPRYRTRSVIEGRLVEIMEKCWKHEMGDRATIADVVSHLRETARLAKVPEDYLTAI